MASRCRTFAVVFVLIERRSSHPLLSLSRHEREYHVWEDVKLPGGKILVPGAVTRKPQAESGSRKARARGRSLYPFQVVLPAHQTGLSRDSKAQAEQIRSVAVERVGGRLGQLPAALVAELDRALRVQLSL